MVLDSHFQVSEPCENFSTAILLVTFKTILQQTTIYILYILHVTSKGHFSNCNKVILENKCVFYL